MGDFASKKCVVCEVGAKPLDRATVTANLTMVKGWKANDDFTIISKDFYFNNFKEAMAFANKVADIAESEGHHPDMLVKWGRARVELSTHSIGGLSENDFILAAKIDGIK